MFCEKCGKENAADVKFCEGCGSPLSTTEAEAPVQNSAEKNTALKNPCISLPEQKPNIINPQK